MINHFLFYIVPGLYIFIFTCIYIVNSYGALAFNAFLKLDPALRVKPFVQVTKESQIPKVLETTSTVKTEFVNDNYLAVLYYEEGFDKWISTKDWQEAQKLYAKSLEVNPQYPPALSSYGYLQVAFENKTEEGLKNILLAHQLDPSWAYAPFNLAIAYDLSGNWTESKKWIKYTKENYKTHPDYTYFLSVFSKMEEFHLQD